MEHQPGCVPAARYQPMPPLSADEYAALKADIAEHGVLVPVEVDEAGAILDGHHRIQAGAELGVDVPTVVRAGLSEAAKHEHALRLNLQRRHLTSAQKRQLVRAELDRDPDRSDRAVGRLCGVDHKTVAAVRGELWPDDPAVPLCRFLDEIGDVRERLHTLGDYLAPLIADPRRGELRHGDVLICTGQLCAAHLFGGEIPHPPHAVWDVQASCLFDFWAAIDLVAYEQLYDRLALPCWPPATEPLRAEVQDVVSSYVHVPEDSPPRQVAEVVRVILAASGDGGAEI